MELLRFLGQAKRLAIAFRIRHAEVALHVFLQIAPLGLSDDRDRRLLKHGDPADDGAVIAITAIAMQLIKCMKQPLQIILRLWPARMTGQIDPVPGTQILIHLFLQLLDLMRQLHAARRIILVLFQLFLQL